MAGYTVGKWHGYPNYRCKRCPYATLSEASMFEHIASHRPALRRVGSELVLVANKNGRQVDVMLPGPAPDVPAVAGAEELAGEGDHE